MIKTVTLLERREDLTHEEFVDYWYDEHVPLAEGLPGVRKYVTALPTDPERSSYDGVAELYFDDMAALAAAFDSEVGEAVEADLSNFADPDAGPTVYVEETVHLDRTGDGAGPDRRDDPDDASGPDTNTDSGTDGGAGT